VGTKAKQRRHPGKEKYWRWEGKKNWAGYPLGAKTRWKREFRKGEDKRNERRGGRSSNNAQEHTKWGQDLGGSKRKQL